MPITIKIGDAAQQEEQKPIQASITLQVKKTLDGNLLINDHKYLDIVISPKENKIITIPKPNVEKDVYDYQKDLMYDLFKGGVTDASAPRGGPVFGMVETTYPAEGDVDTLQAVMYRISEYIKQIADAEQVSEEYDENIEDRFTDPNAKDSTAYGEIPPYQDTPEGRADSADPTYTFAGYGYYY
jgi:hypothetical protein|tara:strand:- start:550 stop:1101 length:552 start_codon:yes stop_codon:yes gene_type:complete